MLFPERDSTMPTAVKISNNARPKLLGAAVNVIRAKGYSATTVDDICHAAGVTKGGFFHHFESKEKLAVAAAGHFSDRADSLFTTAPYRNLADPLDRLLGYVDFRKAILQGELPEFTCLLGTMVQETYDTYPAIREICEKYISANAAMLHPDIEQAMRKYKIKGSWTAESLALHTQAVIQGAFILAKAKHSVRTAADSLDHLHRYLELLFRQPLLKEKK